MDPDVQITTLDYDPGSGADIIYDLNRLPYDFAADNSFNGIVAEEVLEHTGQQGDLDFFFGQFYEFWRMLRPNGRLSFTVPAHTSEWAWGDPGHTRVITPGTMAFLTTNGYEQLGTDRSTMSDYRRFLRGQEWEVIQAFYAPNMARFICTLGVIKKCSCEGKGKCPVCLENFVPL